MKKETKLKIISGTLITTLLLNGAVLTKKSIAETQKSKRGTVIEEPVQKDEKLYLKYIATKDDNLSFISEKICKFYGIKPVKFYWPVIADINNITNTIIHAGDEILFPITFDELQDAYDELVESGRIGLYTKGKRNSGVTKTESSNTTTTPSKTSKNTVKGILSEVYGERRANNPNFVNLYLEVEGLTGKYDMNSVVENTTDLSNFPSTEDLAEYYLKKSHSKQGKQK